MTQEHIDKAIKREYEAGFTTMIEAETFPPGLNESRRKRMHLRAQPRNAQGPGTANEHFAVLPGLAVAFQPFIDLSDRIPVPSGGASPWPRSSGRGAASGRRRPL